MGSGVERWEQMGNDPRCGRSDGHPCPSPPVRSLVEAVFRRGTAFIRQNSKPDTGAVRQQTSVPGSVGSVDEVRRGRPRPETDR